MFISRAPLRALPLASLALAGLAALTACGGNAKATDGKTQVIASFYPMAWLAGKIGGNAIPVETLTKPGAEPHDLELTPRQIGDVRDADFTVYVKGVQPAVDDAVQKNAKDKSLNAASVVKTLPPAGGAEEEHGKADVRYDPHIWLDPSRMAAIATALGEQLAKVDPSHATVYRDGAKAVVTQLTQLDQEYRGGLKSCKRKTIVTSHAAFGYMAERYGLQQVPIAGVDPNSEPSPKRLGELTKQIKSAGATTVFTETLVSPKVAETLANEAGVKTAVLDPVEGVAKGSSDDYMTIMHKNLQILRPALECS